ncbi:MAG: tRNA uridine-5-carboxymethylaminomethyl(34) synthesis GTPase MnmE [Bacteroidaceae bacterium]|nr:tRNA uridine-5-carboxymethylaminomethyl(34) synthesis GTPase MnmE [Bacteroidaceae bacterium]
METKDTICALATAQGGALSVIRISGDKSLTIADKVFKSRSGKALCEYKSHRLVFGDVFDERGEQLDEVILSIMRAPHSYTGEDTVEISCHASSYITQQLLINLIENGARQAEPGEFTMRAFLNGKMDLSRAEAVADVIASNSRAAHRLAMNQLKGGFSRQLSTLRDKLLKLTSLMELELDFSEEDVSFADRRELLQLSADIETVISRLVDSFAIGNSVKNGIPVAIVGETNTGKSTLLNALLNEERAIVSDISGTTRDTVEGNMTIGGVLFRFIDTAGVRKTTDIVEQMGIERALAQLEKCSVALWVIDPLMNPQQQEEVAKNLLPLCQGKQLAILVNKCDVVDPVTLSNTMEWGSAMIAKYGNGIQWSRRDTWAISAKLGINIDKLQDYLVNVSAIPEISANDVVVTNVRHYEALRCALDDIQRVQDALNINLSGDLVSEDLRQCIRHLSEIVGEISSESVLQNIFKNFCIGK